jgi:hypothetical protein
MNIQKLIDAASALVADDKGPQHALRYRAKCNLAARRGNYPAAMEGE